MYLYLPYGGGFLCSSRVISLGLDHGVNGRKAEGEDSANLDSD